MAVDIDCTHADSEIYVISYPAIEYADICEALGEDLGDLQKPQNERGCGSLLVSCGRGSGNPPNKHRQVKDNPRTTGRLLSR